MKTLALAIFVIVVLPMKALSQERSTSSITWTSVSTFHVEQGSTVEETTMLLLIGNERFEWRNNDGSLRRAFQVIETVNDWMTIGSEGSARYEIIDGNTNGSITIQKNAQGIKALIVLVSDETQSYELILQNQ